MFAIRTALLFSLSTGALLAQRTPITHESMWLMPRLSNPTPSPDGRHVVYSLLEPDYDDK
jgi:hypothetical protein